MGILNSYEQIKARLIFWDASVNPKNDHMITRNNKDLLTDLKIEDCNGGTSMSCYADYCEEKNYKCRLHILMTDGYIESDPRVPQGNIIYVLTKSGDDTHLKDTGIVCRLSDVEE
jgi:predicted metal-dependent peptidase